MDDNRELGYNLLELYDGTDTIAEFVVEVQIIRPIVPVDVIEAMWYAFDFLRLA